VFPRELEGQSGSPPWSPGAPKVGEWLVWSLSDPSGRKRRHRREQQGLVSPPLRASPEPARFRFLSGVNPCEKEMRCEAQSQRVSQCPAHARFCGGAMTALLAACWSTCFLRREKEGARHAAGASSGGRPP